MDLRSRWWKAPQVVSMRPRPRAFGFVLLDVGLSAGSGLVVHCKLWVAPRACPAASALHYYLHRPLTLHPALALT